MNKILNQFGLNSNNLEDLKKQLAEINAKKMEIERQIRLIEQSQSNEYQKEFNDMQKKYWEENKHKFPDVLY